MKMSIYDWIAQKRKKGEEIRLVSLLIDVDNSSLLKEATKKMVEEGARVEVDESQVDLSTKEGRERLDRMFYYAINKEALNMLLARTEMAINKVGSSEQAAKELLDRSDLDKETVDEIAGEIAQMKQEVIAESQRVAFIKQQFEDDENIKDFIDSGSVWFSDKQLVLDVIDDLEEVKDDEVDNFVTASTLMSRIDKLIDRINRTIEKIDLYVNDPDGEIDLELKGINVKPLEEDASITLTAEEAGERVKVEETHLPDLKPEAKENKNENEQENDKGKDRSRSKEKEDKQESKSEAQRLAEERAKERAKSKEEEEEQGISIPLGM